MTNYGHLPRRDNRTQPGVLAPGSVKKAPRPHKAHFCKLLRLTRLQNSPIFHFFGLLDVVCLVRIAPAQRVGDAEGAEDISSASRSQAHGSGIIICRPFRARSPWTDNPGLKPRAESYRPFGTSPITRVSRIQNLSFVICHLSFGRA
jgi:hypothetical protein